MNDKDISKIPVPDAIIKKWQNIVDIMAKLIGVPAGLIMRIVDSDIEVFVSSQTSDNPYHPKEKETLYGSGLYCEAVISSRKDLLIPNAPADEKWKNNPDIKLNMISYLGFPILYPNGEPFGTICVLDNKENAYSATFVELVRQFHDIIESDLELFYINHILGEQKRELIDYISEIRTLRGLLPICSSCMKIRDDKGYWVQLEAYIQEHSEARFSHGLCEKCQEKLYGDQEWFKKVKRKSAENNKGEGGRKDESSGE